MSANANFDVLFPMAKWVRYAQVLKLAKLPGKRDGFRLLQRLPMKWGLSMVYDLTTFDR